MAMLEELRASYLRARDARQESEVARAIRETKEAAERGETACEFVALKSEDLDYIQRRLIDSGLSIQSVRASKRIIIFGWAS